MARLVAMALVSSTATAFSPVLALRSSSLVAPTTVLHAASSSATPAAAAVVPLPPAEASRAVFDAGDDRPVILYDGVCNLCNGASSRAVRSFARRPLFPRARSSVSGWSEK